MTDIEAVAKAVEKTAEFGTQALQTGEKAGGFFARVFKEPIEAGVGILTDRLRIIRLQRWAEMADEVDDILGRRGVIATRPVSPKLGIPLLEDAALEDEAELKILWSRLLANAMDPNFEAEVRVAYVDIIKNLNPLDARLMFLMWQSLRKVRRLDFKQARQHPFYEGHICDKLGISRDDYALSVSNLMRLQCVAPNLKRIKLGGGLVMAGGDTHLTANEGISSVVITPLGIRFVDACTDNSSLDNSDALRVRYNRTETIAVGLRVGDS